ncbi:Uncharacterized protein Adt_28543 [Abeliophyllum distichum]|uniref:DUF1985 domain-containing protein n=1 Tax=Abeliophyllum distichum TaxID=126358 RepID=A0ABD1RWU1_9LAMI
MKRVIENSEVGNENFGFKKVRFFDGIDENHRGFETISGGEEKGIIENGVMGVQAIEQNDLLIENEASRSSEMDSSLLRVHDESKWDFDINFDLIFNTRKEENWLDFDINVPSVSNFDMKNGGTEMVFQEYTQCEPAINQRIVEIIDIMSDESDDEVEIIAYKKDDIKKGKQIEVENLNLGLAMIEMENIVGESSLGSGGEKRYAREEKGKAPVVDSWLSVGPNYPIDLSVGPNHPIDLSVGPNYPIDLDLWPDIEGLLDICETWEDVHLLGTSCIEFREEQPPALADRAEILIRQEVGTVRYRGVSRQSAKQLARVDYLTDEFGNGSSSQEHKLPPLEADVQLGNSPGPFSDALKMIRARNVRPDAQKLIEWKPLEENHGRSVTMPLVPSLLDLSLRALAENAEGIVSLELVPDILRRRLTDLLCDIRKMDVHILDLLVKGCPTEIRIKNCSWLTEKQFTQTFKNCESKCLRVLDKHRLRERWFDNATHISLNRLENVFINCDDRRDQYKLGLALLIEGVLKPMDRRKINIETLSLVDNLEVCYDYPWGRPSFFTLLGSLLTSVQLPDRGREIRQYTIYGFPMIFQEDGGGEEGDGEEEDGGGEEDGGEEQGGQEFGGGENDDGEEQEEQGGQEFGRGAKDDGEEQGGQ